MSEHGSSRPRRRGPGNLVRGIWSAWSWFVLGLLVLLWLPMMAVVRVVTAPFDRGHYRTGLLFRKLAVAHQKLNPLWRVRITGDLPDDPRRPYVVVANHESFVDILLISHLPWDMKWLSKEEMFKIPLVGWEMRLAGDVPLRRGDRSSVEEALRQCEDRLSSRVSVMVFPEGTRSKTGKLLDFKDGAFQLAIEQQLPVLPLAVAGTRDALRKHSWLLGEATLELQVLEPVPTAGMTLEDLPALREDVRSRIAMAREAMGHDDGDEPPQGR